MKTDRGYFKQTALWMAQTLPLALPLYLIRFRIGPLPTTLLEVYLVILFIVTTCAFGLDVWKKGWMALGEWRWPVLAWVVTSLFAVFRSPSLLTGFGLWRAYVLEPLIVFVMLFGLREQINRKRIECSIAILIAIVTVWAVFQFVTGQGIPSPWNVSIADGRRATGPFPYPNALALLVVPLGAYLFSRWITEKRSWWLLSAWLMAGLSCVLAKSDGGLLALGFATWLVLMLRKESRKLAIGFATLGIIAVVFVSPVRNAFLEQATFSGWSGRVRAWTWTETWNMLKDHPITGAGFGGYPVAFKPYHEKTFIEIFQYPHTIVFNFWSETGILGLLAFGWVVVMWFQKRLSWISLAALVAILVHGLVDVPYFKNDLAIAFWLLMFLTAVELDRKQVNR
jgi:O-antigen ligase